MESLKTVSTKQQKIARLARIHPGVSFTSMSYYIDKEFLREAYRRTRKDGAAGIDNQTSEDYKQELEQNLESLHERFKSGRYQAPPVRRVYIPKGRVKEMRPIGIPSFEDKVLQRAVHMVLEPLFEQDFHECSYGFRPGRSAHDALQALWERLMKMKGGYIIDLDLRKFFDTVDHTHLRTFLKKRVCDGVITRIIGKWLKAGVTECGQVSYNEAGTPQGGVISPLLSNIYLHEVLDKWFHGTILGLLEAEAFMIRYADDAVLCFKSKRDALRVLKVLQERLGKYGLSLNHEKTRLIEFRRPVIFPEKEKRATFNFLGFTHYWGKSRKGRPSIKRKTEKSKLNRSLRVIAEWCKRNRHLKLREQADQLRMKLRGHYNYYGITGNYSSLAKFRHEVVKTWQKWLNRRSNKRDMCWERFSRLLSYYKLPEARVVHSVYIAKL